jgi:hypothetical protein
VTGTDTEESNHDETHTQFHPQATVLGCWHVMPCICFKGCEMLHNNTADATGLLHALLYAHSHKAWDKCPN